MLFFFPDWLFMPFAYFHGFPYFRTNIPQKRNINSSFIYVLFYNNRDIFFFRKKNQFIFFCYFVSCVPSTPLVNQFLHNLYIKNLHKIHLFLTYRSYFDIACRLQSIRPFSMNVYDECSRSMFPCYLKI